MNLQLCHTDAPPREEGGASVRFFWSQGGTILARGEAGGFAERICAPGLDPVAQALRLKTYYLTVALRAARKGDNSLAQHTMTLALQIGRAATDLARWRMINGN